MAIRRHKDRWLIDVSVDGKRKTSVLPFETAPEDLELVETRLKLELMEERASAMRQAADEKSNKGWNLEQAYRHCLRVRPKWKSDEQRKNVEKQWRVVSAYIPGTTLLAEIDTDRLDEFVQEAEEERHVCGATINRYLSFISAILTEAGRRGKLKAMPFLPKQEEGLGRIRWLNDSEEELLLANALRMEYKDIAEAICVFIDTGMRMGELWQIEAHQIDFDRGVLTIEADQTKTKRIRVLPITDRMAAILRPRCTSPSAFVFPNFSSEGFYRKFVKIAKTAALEKVIPYTLRHTCCSRLVQRGVPLVHVAEHMGHSNLQTTRRYAHLAPQDKDTLRAVIQGAEWGQARAQGIIPQ